MLRTKGIRKQNVTSGRWRGVVKFEMAVGGRRGGNDADDEQNSIHIWYDLAIQNKIVPGKCDIAKQGWDPSTSLPLPICVALVVEIRPIYSVLSNVPQIQLPKTLRFLSFKTRHRKSIESNVLARFFFHP